jgi:hypothetical protein
MKRLILYTVILFTVGVAFSSCYKDVLIPTAAVDPDGPPQAVSYTTDLAPLFNTNCAVAGCHVTGSEKPFLTTDISYNQIVNNGYVNLLVPKQSILYEKINGDMREHIPLASDRQKVYDWIRNGAPNN